MHEKNSGLTNWNQAWAGMPSASCYYRKRSCSWKAILRHFYPKGIFPILRKLPKRWAKWKFVAKYYQFIHVVVHLGAGWATGVVGCNKVPRLTYTSSILLVLVLSFCADSQWNNKPYWIQKTAQGALNLLPTWDCIDYDYNVWYQQMFLVNSAVVRYIIFKYRS